MIEAKTKKIGEYTYKVSQLGAVKGRGAFIRLARMLGSAISDPDKEKGLAVLSKVATLLVEDDVTYFCDLFAPYTQFWKDPKQVRTLSADGVFDLHFAGKYLEMAQWLRFCIEVNFGSVFQGLASAVARGSEKVAAESASTSPSELTGTSIAS